MSESDFNAACAYVAENPACQSLLCDWNLLPEQCTSPAEQDELCSIVAHFKAHNATTTLQRDELYRALAELVACKSLKDAIDDYDIGEGEITSDAEQMCVQADYDIRKPLAWDAARKSLAAVPDPRQEALKGKPSCTGCLGSGWCEGSPGWKCKDCNGTGVKP